MRLLDRFCSAGGAGMGYRLAGFEVVGVDIRPQPNYPFEFHQGDALDEGFIASLGPFDAQHASPVCLTFARVTDWRGSRSNYPDTLTPTLAQFARLTCPWVVENVLEACPPLRPDFITCGSNYGLNVCRKRAFQFGNWSSYRLIERCRCRANPDLLPFEHKNERAFADAMGCTWMSKEEARQAVPVAYTQDIGRQLMAALATTQEATA